MFVDASAIIAIIADEADAGDLSGRLARGERVAVSPIALYEATTGLARKRACSIEDAASLVEEFAEATGARIIDITAAIARDAARAFGRFGRGRHRADLNMGDCFSYACARAEGLRLLFKGDDFVHTDIEAA
jgi:ribonuclease VapC